MPPHATPVDPPLTSGSLAPAAFLFKQQSLEQDNIYVTKFKSSQAAFLSMAVSSLYSDDINGHQISTQ